MFFNVFVFLLLIYSTHSFKYGSFESPYNAEDLKVTLKSNGKIYLQQQTENPNDNELIPQHSDELIGAFDDRHSFEPVTPLSIAQVLKMPHGSFLLPIILPDKESKDNIGTLVKFLRVEIVSPDSLMWRPKDVNRRDAMEILQQEKSHLPERVRALHTTATRTPSPIISTPIAVASLPIVATTPPATTPATIPIPVATHTSTAPTPKIPTTPGPYYSYPSEWISTATNPNPQYGYTDCEASIWSQTYRDDGTKICYDYLNPQKKNSHDHSSDIHWDNGHRYTCEIHATGDPSPDQVPRLHYATPTSTINCDFDGVFGFDGETNNFPKYACCSCGGGSTTPGLNCPGGSATLPLIKIIAPIPTPVPTPTTTPAPVISSTTSSPTAPSKHDNLFFDYDLLKYNPVVIRIMGSISSISYKGGHEKWIQHLKQEAIDPATQQETICGCSFLKNGNDIKTMCLIDVIVQSGASGLQECKDTCQKLDNGAMIKFGTLMTSALPVIPGLCCNTMYNIDIGDTAQGGYKYCQPKQNAETKRRVFEYKKEFARNAALIMAEKAAAIQNGQDPSLVKIEVEVEVEVVPQQATEIDPDMVAKEMAEKIRIEQEKKQEQQQEEQQKQQQKQEEEQQKHEDAEAVAAAALPTPPIDEYIYNELKFAHKGPLGLKLVPNTLPFTIESQSHNLLPGDEMTLINGEDVLDCETSDEIMEILIEASYPKTIQFRRKIKKKVIKSIEDIAEERAAKGFLYLTEPPLLHGYKIPFSVAEFGKLRRASLSNVSDIENDDANKDIQNFCDPSRNTIKIRVAVPIDGCQTARPYQRSTNATHTDTSIVYAMVKRGACPFTKKAETIEKAGYNGIILFNNDLNQELIRMPAKRNFKTKEIIPINFNGHAVMIDSMNGALLHTSILTGSTPTKQLFLNMQGIFKTNECISHQLEMFATPSIWTKKIDETTELQKNKNIKFTDTQGNTRDVVKDNEKSLAMIEKSNVVPDGHLIMWNGNKHSRTLPVVIAGFGEIDYQKLIHLPPSRVILGIPEDGCDDKGFSNSVKGAWVIVKRGGCSFVEKVRNIQNVGGTAALIINTRKKPYLFEMPMGPEGAPDLIIPVLQIPMDSVMEIEYMKYEGVNILGRVDWNKKEK